MKNKGSMHTLHELFEMHGRDLMKLEVEFIERKNEHLG
jgi:hypothetical protein